MILIALMQPAAAQDVAITEFINDSLGTEPAAEWVELFNFGPVDVDLTDFAIADEDSDNSLIPAGTVIPAGSFLILSNDPMQFVTDWGVGTAGVDVVTVGMTIANGADELQLLDAAGAPVWTLAYADDETLGFTTWLTDTTFAIRSHGDKLAPGVVRAGDDNGQAGYLGYEDAAVTADPFARVALNGDSGSPLDGPYGGVVAAPSLAIGGVCPGAINMFGSNLTPNDSVALLTANAAGNGALPGGPCVGEFTGLDLGSMVFRGTFNTDAVGEVLLSPSLPAGACGMAVQMLDLTTCELTNVSMIP